MKAIGAFGHSRVMARRRDVQPRPSCSDVISPAARRRASESISASTSLWRPGGALEEGQMRKPPSTAAPGRVSASPPLRRGWRPARVVPRPEWRGTDARGALERGGGRPQDAGDPRQGAATAMAAKRRPARGERSRPAWRGADVRLGDVALGEPGERSAFRPTSRDRDASPWRRATAVCSESVELLPRLWFSVVRDAPKRAGTERFLLYKKITKLEMRA